MTEPMASEPAEPTTRPQDDVIERARQLIDDEVLTRTGRSVGDLASGHVARALAEAGLLADPERVVAGDAYRSVVVALKGKEAALEEIEAALGVKLATGEPYSRLAEIIRERLADPAQTTELEKLRADNERLRKRIHEAVNETQRRYAKYQKAYYERRNTVEFANRLFADAGADFGFSSAAGRALVLDTIEQRDALSLLLRGMARKLVAYRKWMSGDDVPVVYRLRREAEERQGRLDAITETLAATGRMMTSDARDWSLSRSDVWLYSLLVSWECEERHEHDEVMCGGDGALREVAAQHGWTVEDIARIRRFRAALVGDQPPTEGPKPTPEDFHRALTDVTERANRALDAGNLDRQMQGRRPLPLFPEVPPLSGDQPKARCCIGPFADGSHAVNCWQRCQDCGNDEGRCRCADAGPDEDQEKRAAADWPAESVDVPAPGDCLARSCRHDLGRDPKSVTDTERVTARPEPAQQSAPPTRK